MKKTLFVLLVLIVVGSCATKSESERALEIYGRGIQTVGVSGAFPDYTKYNNNVYHPPYASDDQKVIAGMEFLHDITKPDSKVSQLYGFHPSVKTFMSLRALNDIQKEVGYKSGYILR